MQAFDLTEAVRDVADTAGVYVKVGATLYEVHAVREDEDGDLVIEPDMGAPVAWPPLPAVR